MINVIAFDVDADDLEPALLGKYSYLVYDCAMGIGTWRVT